MLASLAHALPSPLQLQPIHRMIVTIGLCRTLFPSVVILAVWANPLSTPPVLHPIYHLAVKGELALLPDESFSSFLCCDNLHSH